MIHQFIWGHLRYNRAQAAVNAAGISFEVMSVLLLAKTSRNLDAEFYAVKMIGWITVYAILWLVLLVSALFVAVARFQQIRERTQEFAILKMLGASTGYIFDLLCQETLLVLIPGTVLGILMASGGGWLIELVMPDTFYLRRAYEWWPLSCLIAALSFLFPAMLAIWVATRGDLVEGLGYEE